MLGVEVVLDVADDAARLAHAPLAQQHDLEVVASAVAARGSPGGERHGGWRKGRSLIIHRWTLTFATEFPCVLRISSSATSSGRELLILIVRCVRASIA